MSAESNMVRPASRQMSTSLVASAMSDEPHALKNSFEPPNVPVPRLSAGTLNPDPPNSLYSMGLRVFVAQCAPQDLTDHGFRQLDSKFDVRRHLVRRQVLSAEVPQLGLRRRLTAAQHDP